MHLLDHLVHSIISILFNRENNFNFIHLAKTEENNVSLVFTAHLSSSIIAIEIYSSTT